MDLTQYLTGIGRRWKVIVACMIVALAVGWVVSPQEAGSSAGPTRTYRATTYLLGTSTGGTLRSGSTSTDTVAALATLGEVPRRVADEINFDGDPDALAATVTAAPDDTTGLLTIAATAPTPARAELVADTFADKLLEFLSERTQAQVHSIRRQIAHLDRRIERLSEQLPQTTTTDTSGVHEGTPGTTLDPEDAAIQSQIDDLSFTRQTLQQQLATLSSDSGGNLAGFEVVEPAAAEPVAASAGLEAPRSRTIRLAIAAAIGLLLGLALALLLERFDTRIRTKPAAETAFGLPVLAVVPSISRRRRGTVITEASPRGPATNAFRLLTAALQFGGQDGAHAPAPEDGAPKTILVASGEPREGRSTVAADLAATFAEVGKRVVVVGCDYRHPTLHATFGVELEPGLTEALEDDLALDRVLQGSSLEHVRVLSSGRVPVRAGEMLGSDRMRTLMARLREVADVVVIDTSPVLAASDWTQLIPSVDAVIVVARAGRTDAASARRTGEALGLLKAPVVGVTLNDVPRGPLRRASDRSWYRYQAPDRRSRSPRPARPEAAPEPRREADPVVVVAPEAAGSNHGNGDLKSDEGIPHLARPSVKD